MHWCPNWTLLLSINSSYGYKIQNRIFTLFKHLLLVNLKPKYKKPLTFAEALIDSSWFSTMKEEYNALVKNQTLTLVASQPNKHSVNPKLVYKIKLNVDGFYKN